jgi:hypothetical protein
VRAAATDCVAQCKAASTCRWLLLSASQAVYCCASCRFCTLALSQFCCSTWLRSSHSDSPAGSVAAPSPSSD